MRFKYNLLMLLLLVGLHPIQAVAAADKIPCFPSAPYLHQLHGDVPLTASTRYDSYAIWVCQQPTGYTTTYTMYVGDSVAAYMLRFITGKWTLQQANDDCAKTCVPFVQPELDFIMPLVRSANPIALVAYNQNSTTRPVYAANADGTLNPTPVANASVAVGARCLESKRLVVASTYYSVQGLPNLSQPGQVLGDFYTICSVQTPIGAN